jgi:glycogen debranching enzyme
VDDLRAAAEALLRDNWRQGRYRDGTPYAYTCPAPRRYVHQWYWDSCFHAIVWTHLDPGRAREELRTLLRAGRLDGFIPHTIFWDRPARWRRAPFYGTHTFLGDLATATTQTPLLALAWERVAQASEDEPEFAAEALPELQRHYDWLSEQRDPDGDGLISIIHPDESGLDDSPKYDQAFRWMAHYRPGYFWLVERCRRLGYDSLAILDRYEEHVEDVLVNVCYALSLDALERLSGDPAYGARARQVERALMECCYDPGTGLFYDLAGTAERPLCTSTWSSLTPLALPGIEEAVRRRLVEEHLLDPRRYRAAFGIPSVAMDEPSFVPGFDRFRCWRGPSWVNTSWFLVPPMIELGYAEEAARVVDSLREAIARGGFREYYNPLTARGHGASRFAWSTLVLDLLERAPDGASQRLNTATGASR